MLFVQSFWKMGIYVSRDNVFLMNIEQLIERGKQSDETALEHLYAAYHRRMTAICQRIVGEREVAEELAHDAFLLAFANLDSLRQPKRFKSWLTSITTHVALRYKERMHEPVMLSLSALSESELAQEITPTDAKPLPTMAELMEAVEALPNGYKRVFKLAVIEEMSHKEIAEIMGIAAHSSSSQLARAKKMLQKSLAHYWLLWLLLVLLPVTYLLLRTGRDEEELKPIATKQREPKPIATKQVEKEKPIVHPDVQEVQNGRTHRMANAPVMLPQSEEFVLTDSVPQNVEQTDTTTITNNRPQPEFRPDNDIHFADFLPEKPAEVNDRQQTWSVDFAYTVSMDEQNINRPFVLTEKEMIDSPTADAPSVFSFDKWSDYAEALQSGIFEGDYKTQQILMKIAQNNANLPDNDQIVRRSHHYMPVTLSLAMKYQFSSHFGLETGLSYSRLKSDFEVGTNGNAIHDEQIIHYIGIPLKGSYLLYNGKLWSLYGSLGITVEIPVQAQLSTSYYVNGTIEASDVSTLHASQQWSVSTGFGLQIDLTSDIGFFAEPSLQYNIPTGGNIETYRTEHPFTFTVPMGIRITW